MRGAKITLLHLPDGSMRLRYKDRDLQYTQVKSSPRPSPAEDEKTIDARLDAVLAARRDDSPTAEPARAWITGGLATFRRKIGELERWLAELGRAEFCKVARLGW